MFRQLLLLKLVDGLSKRLEAQPTAQPEMLGLPGPSLSQRSAIQALAASATRRISSFNRPGRIGAWALHAMSATQGSTTDAAMGSLKHCMESARTPQQFAALADDINAMPQSMQRNICEHQLAQALSKNRNRMTPHAAMEAAATLGRLAQARSLDTQSESHLTKENFQAQATHILTLHANERDKQACALAEHFADNLDNVPPEEVLGCCEVLHKLMAAIPVNPRRSGDVIGEMGQHMLSAWGTILEVAQTGPHEHLALRKKLRAQAEKSLPELIATLRDHHVVKSPERRRHILDDLLGNAYAPGAKGSQDSFKAACPVLPQLALNFPTGAEGDAAAQEMLQQITDRALQRTGLIVMRSEPAAGTQLIESIESVLRERNMPLDSLPKLADMRELVDLSHSIHPSLTTAQVVDNLTAYAKKDVENLRAKAQRPEGLIDQRTAEQRFQAFLTRDIEKVANQVMVTNPAAFPEAVKALIEVYGSPVTDKDKVKKALDPVIKNMYAFANDNRHVFITAQVARDAHNNIVKAFDPEARIEEPLPPRRNPQRQRFPRNTLMNAFSHTHHHHGNDDYDDDDY